MIVIGKPSYISLAHGNAASDEVPNDGRIPGLAGDPRARSVRSEMSVFEAERTANVDKLVELLQTSESVEVRRHVADTLGEIDDPAGTVIDCLIGAALEDPEASVRAVAVDALDEIGAEATEQFLVEMAGLDVDPAAATWSRVEAFADTLDAERPEIRMAAASALGRSGDPDGVPPLLDRLGDPDPRVRARIVRACGRLADQRCATPLSDLADDDQAVVRHEVAEALGSLDGDEPRTTLQSLATDSSVSVRRAAVSSLGSFETEKALETLVEALSDPVDTVRRAAVYSVISLLSNAPAERSDALRNAVVDRLSSVADGEILIPLIEILRESQSAQQRRNTAWLLGRITDESQAGAAVTALVEALEDDDAIVSQFAATGLTHIGGSVVADALIGLLDDDTASTRAKAMAAFALGDVGGDRAEERLDTLIQESDDEEVRRRAFAALSNLEGRGDGVGSEA